MTSLTVIRRVPAPIIGTCGISRNREFEAFEERLDWLEAASCMPVIRLDPDDPEDMRGLPPSVTQLLAEEGGRALPVVLIGGVIVSRGVYPTRTQLAHWVGSHRTLTDASVPH